MLPKPFYYCLVVVQNAVDMHWWLLCLHAGKTESSVYTTVVQRAWF
jgi:hypothetical protein